MEGIEHDAEEHVQTVPSGSSQTPPLCRFFSQGRRCNFGRRCRFLHQREDAKIIQNEKNSEESQKETCSSQGDISPPAVEENRYVGYTAPMNLNAPLLARPEKASRPCRYFLSGFCSMEERCRFWHPVQLSLASRPINLIPEADNRLKRMPAQATSNVLQEVKLCDLTEDVAKQLRETEIKQLIKRFPKDGLIIQERSDGQVTFYRASVEATDPDWPFDLKQIDIMVSFPEKYPLEIFTLDIPADQDLPLIMGRHVQQASMEWLQAKHATNELMGKVELLFRPFLRWLDRSMERLFTEGARELKKDIDLEKAGLQFIPYQELQTAVCKVPDHATNDDTREADEEMTVEEGKGADEGGSDSDEQMEASHAVENIKISDPRRGTEVKLLGLSLGDNTATVVAKKITVCLQCNRCKVTADLSVSGKAPCTAQCEKCSASIKATFRPSMLHHYSDVLGHLDLHSSAATDLVLLDCEFAVGCLSCSQECILQNLSYGQTKEFNCEHCHSKLCIKADSATFHYIQPRVNKTGLSDSALNSQRGIRDPAVQKGKPLPETGTCKHFKQSHRWLRFPCCGRAYPCDTCHDEDQDHIMERATRMICGHCAKEQPYSNGKPCVNCGNMMTRGAHTSHWEGGLGCRNKVKMNRNDRQKYCNINKTVSRKAANEK